MRSLADPDYRGRYRHGWEEPAQVGEKNVSPENEEQDAHRAGRCGKQAVRCQGGFWHKKWSMEEFQCLSYQVCDQPFNRSYVKRLNHF